MYYIQAYEQTFNFPEDVGLGLGEADSPKIVLLETHYDNPDLESL